ncbi:hypothetical protein [Comamonas sp.]|uniref:hypothetical protein n=1 Tax=Comamonas sp. TaxID=34028 RepID=UPI002647DADF|nr:hypothetical protein [Comamonas sp.]MDN5540478.1 hypothetical protein [Comamonas sp.]
MMFTTMPLTGQLDAAGADRFARRIAAAYVLAALGITAAGLGGLIAAIRWW